MFSVVDRNWGWIEFY